MPKTNAFDETFFNIKKVDGEKKSCTARKAGEVNYDLLISIPAHKGMEVLEKNDLGRSIILSTQFIRIAGSARWRLLKY